MVLYLLAPAIISWNNNIKKLLCSLLSFFLCAVLGFGEIPVMENYLLRKARFCAVCIVCCVCVFVCDPLKNIIIKKRTKANKSIHNPQQAMFATNEWCSGHLGHKQMLDGFLFVVCFFFILFINTRFHNSNCNKQNLLVNCVLV